MILASLSPEQTLKDPPPFFLQSPNNNNNNNNTTTKRVWTFFIHTKKRRKSSGGREERDDDDAVRRLLSCFDEISFVSFCAMLFRYFICVSLQIFKNQTNHKFKPLILFLARERTTVAHWRRITRRSVYDRSFLPPPKGITTERVLRQQNFVVVVKKGRR